MRTRQGELATYAIRVNGHLDDHWSAWLGETAMIRDDNGTTIITVSTADQARLHGVLAGLRDIGAEITELRTTWKYRQLDSVNEWLAGRAAGLVGAFRGRGQAPRAASRS